MLIKLRSKLNGFRFVLIVIIHYAMSARWMRSDGECVPVANASISNVYRYPVGVAPGDVYVNKNKFRSHFTPGTVAYWLFEELMPVIIGIILLFLFLTTIAYLCFSIMRLFYLDTLKQYKLNTLKSLGKHKKYYKNKDDKRKKNLPTLNTLELEFALSQLQSQMETESEPLLAERVKRKTPADLPHLEQPPEQKLSMTSPPMQKPFGEMETAADQGYPHVIDLLNTGGLKEQEQFPSKVSKLYDGHKAKSRIPRPVPKKDEKPFRWGDWYKKQLEDQIETGKTVANLQATRTAINLTASEQFDLTQPPEPPKPQQPKLRLLRYMARDPARTESHEPVSNQEPPQTPTEPPDTPTKTKKKRKHQHPPQEWTGNLDTPLPSPSPSRKELMDRYTKVDPIEKHFTTIPKKLTYKQQLTILRGGPRRDSKEIKELRKKQKRRGTWEKRSWEDLDLLTRNDSD